MDWREWALDNLLGPSVRRRVERAAREAVSHAEEDRYYRALSARPHERDLTPATWREQQAEVYEAYLSNPLAFRAIELITSYVVGAGVSVTSDDPAVRAAVRDFWDHPANRMDERIHWLCRELLLYGEQFVRLFPDGTIGQIDPSTIDEIETAPDNVEEERRFHQIPLDTTGCDVSARSGTTMVSADTSGTWFTADEVLHFAINRVSNARRGRSALAPVLPWLRRYKDWLVDRARLNKYRAAFVWDVTLRGASSEEIARRMSMWAAPPEPGTVLFHNESEVWQAPGPNIAAGESARDGRAIRLMVATGLGLPEHWLAEGDYTNRATAAEMGAPAYRMLRAYQDYFGHFLRALLDRALTARLGRRFGGRGSYRLTFPDLAQEDNRVLAEAAERITRALGTAVERGWCSDALARELFFRFMGERVAEEVE